jgi:glycosyltransferase involved in cell wall biosynthesis
MMRVIRLVDPDIVHANAAISARIAGQLCGKKTVHTRHCYFPLQRGSGLAHLLRNLGNRKLSDLAIATSESAAENLRDMGIPSRNIRVILNGSDPVREVEEWEINDLRERWGLSQEDFCVGICARLEPYKGHATFLRAVERLCEMDLSRQMKFLIVGEGKLRRHIEQNVRALGLAERVRIVGFVEDMAPVYRLLRVLVNASSGTETSCLAISEGMSASLPVVATDYGGNRVMIGKGNAGIVVPVDDPVAMAEAIRRIASDEVLEHTMREAAHERYLNHFTAARMTRETERVYFELMEKK